MLLIPAIDLRGGNCVRLLHGDFAAERRYDVAPHDLLAHYRSLGSSWLHIVDLDGARDGTPANRPVIGELASQRAVRLQVGGGLRGRADIDALLRNGVNRVVIGSSAIKAPGQVIEWLGHYGPQRIVLAFDVRLDQAGVPYCSINGWQEDSAIALWDAVDRFVPAGLARVLCTDIGRDGALSGPNVELYREAVRRFPKIAWQASGGIREAADLHALSAAGVEAAICGRALLENRISAAEIGPFLRDA